MTIKQLKALCDEQLRKGNGDKEIWLANDEEGNGFHKLIYSFEENVEDYAYSGDFKSGDNKTKIILG